MDAVDSNLLRAPSKTPKAPLDDLGTPQPTPDQVATGADVDSTPKARADDAVELPLESGKPAVDERSMVYVLRHRHFRTFWIAAFGSFVGNWFEFIGTQWIVAEKTRDTTWLATLGAAQLLPTLFLGLLGGIVADRVNRKKLLMATQFAMMIIALAFFVVVHWHYPIAMSLFGNQAEVDQLTLRAFAYGATAHNAGLVNTLAQLAQFRAVAGTFLLYSFLTLALLQGITVAFNNPAWQVMIPRLVPRTELVRAITLQGISFNTARAIGPAIAGVILGWLGGEWLFLVNAASYIGVMVAVTTTPDAPAPAQDGKLTSLSVILADVKHAFGFVFRNRGPRAALLAIVVFSVFGTPVLRFLPLFVTEVYHLREETFGVLTGIMGVGAVVGGLAMRYIPLWYPKHHFIPMSVFLGGLSILAYALVTNVWVAGVLMFVVGVFWMWSFNSAMSALQLLVDDSLRGRVMAVCNMVALGLMPVGPYIASFFGDMASRSVKHFAPSYWHTGLDTQSGIALTALILVAAGIVMVIWRTPEVDGLKPGETGFDRVPGFMRGLTASAHRPRA
ncbi:MAG: MFS transporter [Planctomycetes bacterium]|nr:MFS transporter [Planctomycetota bacterium]